MIKAVRARAYGNVALVKYWGKRNIEFNWPATPSLSLAIDALKTETSIKRDEEDHFFLDSGPSTEKDSSRVFEIVQRWRDEGLIDDNFEVRSENSFPAGTGLASSASGIAALVTALNGISDTPLKSDDLSRRARRGSGSAARSISGGLSILPNHDDPIAKKILPPENISWGIAIAITDPSRKSVGSREAMELSHLTSPYYNAWVNQAENDYKEILSAVDKSDFTHMGEIAERNCLAMHACIMASQPPLVYWNSATVTLIHAVRQWRSEGLESYFTIDAGAQVFVIGQKPDLDTISRKLADLECVKKILTGLPAGGAEVIERIE